MRQIGCRQREALEEWMKNARLIGKPKYQGMYYLELPYAANYDPEVIRRWGSPKQIRKKKWPLPKRGYLDKGIYSKRFLVLEDDDRDVDSTMYYDKESSLVIVQSAVAVLEKGVRLLCASNIHSRHMDWLFYKLFAHYHELYERIMNDDRGRK